MTTHTVYPGIDEYMKPFYKYFHRSEGRELATCYLVGLMMEGERKSVEPMSEKVNASERSMQRLLTDIKWDEKGVIQEHRQGMLAETSDPQGILAIDDTAFPKKGAESVCVARQYCGATGKIDNCQVGVSVAYVGQGVAWPYSMELFIPKEWDNPEDPRRTKTHMPENVQHREKWRMALDLLDEARDNAVPHRAAVADSWYGNIPDFRKGLDDRNESYVVGIYANTEVFLEPPFIEYKPPSRKARGRPRKHPLVINVNPQPVEVSALGEKIAEDAWERLELRRDVKDRPLVVEAVSLRVWPANGYRKGLLHEQVWLIIERRGGGELRYFFSNMPQEQPTIEMVRAFHERFWIEHGYQQLKEELGMDHHEGRSWTGWHRHVLLTFIAFGYLTLLRLTEKKLKSQQYWGTWMKARTDVGRQLLI